MFTATRKCLSSIAVLVLGAGAAAQEPLPQQSPSPQPQGQFTGVVQVRVVNVDVFVTDRSGQPVVGLDKDDFELLVGGEPVEITNFYAESGARVTAPPAAEPSRAGGPREDLVTDLPPPDQRGYVLVFVDNTQIRGPNRKLVLGALEEVVATRLRPSDVVAVVSYGGGLRIHSDFLSDRAAIGKIFAEIVDVSARPSDVSLERRRILSELGRGSSGGLAGRGAAGSRFANDVVNQIRAYSENQYQAGRASIEALHRIIAWMAGVPGRKSLVYVSDGIVNRPGEDLYVAWNEVYGAGNPNAAPGMRRIDFNSDYERVIGRFDLLQDFRQVVGLANKTGVTLYAVDAESDHTTEIRGAGVEFGASSEATSVIDANYREPLEYAAQATGGVRIQSSSRLGDELARVAQDFSSYYSLGFTPRSEDDDRLHDIKVRVKQKGLVVRHREAFQATSPDEASSSRVLSALLFGTTANPLGFRLEPEEVQQRDDGTRVLPTRVVIPLDRVTLVPDQGVYRARLSIFVTVRKASGDASPVQKLPLHLNIPAEKIGEAVRDAAHYPLPVVLRSDDRQVAVGVRDDFTSVTSTARLDVSGL